MILSQQKRENDEIIHQQNLGPFKLFL